MCFSANVSISTYIIGMIGSIILLFQGYIPEGIIYIWVIQMQLIEFVLWKTIPNNNKYSCILPSLNIITTKLGIIINHLEPIVLWLAIILFSKKVLPNIIHIVLILFIIVSILYTLQVLKVNECTIVTDKSYPHLQWNWNHGTSAAYYYIFFLLVLLILCIFGLERGFVNAFIVLFSFLISWAIYGEKHSVGAMWCFAASFGPWILIFAYTYFY